MELVPQHRPGSLEKRNALATSPSLLQLGAPTVANAHFLHVSHSAVCITRVQSPHILFSLVQSFIQALVSHVNVKGKGGKEVSMARYWERKLHATCF